MTRVSIGLVNNMPDVALEATETQFSTLLAAAAGSGTLEVRLTSLPEVPRGPAAAARIAATYWPLTRMFENPPDALIVTGAEPLAADLSDEPYWTRLTELLEWASTYTASSIWSCLAAHAAVQYHSGIRRRRLSAKCHGVFEHALSQHPLMEGMEVPLRTPHSRWNDLPEPALHAAGYETLSRGAQTGANIFVKRRNGSLLVFLQGHPEYACDTLLREYRRDVGRFVQGQQQHYPHPPQGYFSPAALELIESFQQRATSERRAEVMLHFPSAALQSGLQDTWRTATTQFYRNWLRQVAAGRRPNTES